jgi:anti-sigma regulatory factor (Ser/Thr protein kinase)
MTSHEPPPTRDGAEVAAVDQPFDADGLYSLRAALAAHASRLGASPAMLDRLLIVAGELATNAVRHGGGTGRLRLWRTGDELRCQISDRGPGIADPAAGHQLPGPTATNGRGMWICRQLCDELIIDSDHHGTAITAVLRLPGP